MWQTGITTVPQKNTTVQTCSFKVLGTDDVRNMWLSCVEPGHFATTFVNFPVKNKIFELNIMIVTNIIIILLSLLCPYSLICTCKQNGIPQYIITQIV